MRGSAVELYRSMEDRGRPLLYFGLFLLSFIVWLVGQWAIATYDPMDYGAGAIIGLFILAFEVVGLYAAFRFYQLRHAQ
jgi:hypothetical protein